MVTCFLFLHINFAVPVTDINISFAGLTFFVDFENHAKINPSKKFPPDNRWLNQWHDNAYLPMTLTVPTFPFL